MSRRGTFWFGWALALVAMAGFARLGFWQYGRMQEKQQLLDRVASVLKDGRAIALGADQIPPTPVWVEGDGRFLDDVLLLDNQQREGRQGVRVYCVLVLDSAQGGGHRLVELGWAPYAGSRTLPVVACPSGTHHVRGLLLKPPSSGIAMGPAMQAVGPHRWLMARMDVEAVDAIAGIDHPWNDVVRLDPKLPIGYARDLDVLPNTLPPERHLGYAVQWWALSLAVFITALVLSIRKPKPNA